MMALLRSRMTMYVLAALVTVGMVATGAVGLFTMSSAPAPKSPAPEGSQQPPAPAPEMSEIGEAPGDASYTDLGQQCEGGECYRLVGIAAEDLDSEEAVDTVYDHLLDKGWGQTLPQGEDDPDDVPTEQTYLTNGSVLLKGSTDPYGPDTTAGLMLTHAQPPS
ncbi:hypothetical protein FHX37_4164 [Haloactinospora alba]|uniref:Uncharacterized protein n=1 Tax=Haloactinospora alba TaxID=405555 RepID=A0A543NAG5_9ACTN|nr:hypothetical protein [Haloactinospora alba]TQN28799.1 hypothetical protein FHX37_4164 [Haloactinospora alba]